MLESGCLERAWLLQQYGIAAHVLVLVSSLTPHQGVWGETRLSYKSAIQGPQATAVVFFVYQGNV